MSIKTLPCVGHPEKIGQDVIADLVKEWEVEEMTPYFGCVCMNLIIMRWEDLFDPVKTLKDDDLYDHLSRLVNANTFSGKIYRGTDFYYNLKSGDTIDYSNRLTSWSHSPERAMVFTDYHKPIIFELEAINQKGLELGSEHRRSSEQEVILAECKLLILDKKIEPREYIIDSRPTTRRVDILQTLVFSVSIL